MDERWRAAFQEWSRTRDHVQRVREAEDVIRSAMDRASRPYVAFSGGKDSTALLHLVTRQEPGVMVWHWDFGRSFVPRPLHEESLAIARAAGARRLQVDTSQQYEAQGRQARGVWARSLFARVLPRLQAQGYDLGFVGIRAEESGKRRRRIAAGRSLSSIQECWPLAAWTWMDVWAYLLTHDLPWLSTYDREAALVGWDRVRFSTFFSGGMDYLGASAAQGVLHWRWRWRHDEQEPRP